MITNAKLNGRRVCFVDGKWIMHEDIIARTSDMILAALESGPKTRRYLGGSIGGDAKFIDFALRRLASAGRVASSEGDVLNRRRGKTWVALG